MQSHSKSRKQLPTILTHVTHIVNPHREGFSGPVDVPLGQWLAPNASGLMPQGFFSDVTGGGKEIQVAERNKKRKRKEETSYKKMTFMAQCAKCCPKQVSISKAQ